MGRAYEEIYGINDGVYMNLRRMKIGLISLGAVLVIYFGYSQMNRMPEIKLDSGPEAGETAIDSNKAELLSNVGKVGDVGIGGVKMAEFTTLKKNKQVDRKWGFERLLHTDGDEWEIEKPFMRIFRRGFQCYTTADKGLIRVETSIGQPKPSDATFSGNVVIHIIPEEGSNTKESYIYLDDVVYISEKSQFGSTGPIRFISPEVKMEGKGLEIIYNQSKEVLDYLRISKLDNIRVRTGSKRSLMTSNKGEKKDENKGDEKVEASKGEETSIKEETAAADEKAEKASGKKKAIYRCVLSKNVLIDSAEQLVSSDEFSINNIVLGSVSDGDAKNEESGGETASQAKSGDVNSMSDVNDSAEEELVMADQNDVNRVVSSPGCEEVKGWNEMNAEWGWTAEAAKGGDEIVVTCDNGIVLIPEDSVEAEKKFAELTGEPDSGVVKPKTELKDAGMRTTFVTEKIDYDYSTEVGAAKASGSSELTFYVNDSMVQKEDGRVLPVKVTAKEKVEFMPASNRVMFEGACQGTMVRKDGDLEQKYTITADRFTVDLAKDKSKKESEAAADIEHFAAEGGTVQLANSKMVGETLIGFVKLKCLKYDYDPKEDVHMATGPGLIAMDNSKIAETKGDDGGRFSLKKPCYGLVENFDALKYYTAANKIIADSETGKVGISYVPMVDGKEGQVVRATAGHLEVNLLEGADQQNMISTIKAERGATFEEEAKENKAMNGKELEFASSGFFYDANTGLITFWGDESQQSMVNGAKAEGLEYNVKTGKWKADVVGPGTIQMR